MPAIIELSHKSIQGCIVIVAIATCPSRGHQEFQVAQVEEPESPNPGIRFLAPVVACGMAEKVCAYVRNKPWEYKTTDVQAELI